MQVLLCPRKNCQIYLSNPYIFQLLLLVREVNNTVSCQNKDRTQEGWKIVRSDELKEFFHMSRMKEAKLIGHIVHSGKTIKPVPNYGGVNFKEELLA